jgi:ATP-dependent DNA helicase DinG
VSARAAGLVALAETIRDATRGADEGHAAWIEADARGNAVLLRAPVDAAPHLREALFTAFDTVVLTSATLAVGRPPSFRYARERLGVDDADEVVLGSPFDYARQARIVVRADLPDPARAPGAYDAALPDAVLEAVRRTDGGAFVLFTSYDAMRRTAAAIRADLVGDGLLVLVQGEELPRSAMLERFRADNSVLFGVSSFWQGVDVPGDALRNVVIARLPFEVPTHPLARARQARLERAGRSPFEHLSLPQAALKLKQGFGRLIRRATDRGLVVILDPAS